MSRTVFALRFGAVGQIVTEPMTRARAGESAWERATPEWFVACRECLNVRPCRDRADAQRMAGQPCPCHGQVAA